MGIALYDLGFYHSAQHYFLEVVRKGPNNPFFQYAMPKLTGIAKVTGNDYELLRIVTEDPARCVPASGAQRAVLPARSSGLFEGELLRGHEPLPERLCGVRPLRPGEVLRRA